MKPELLVQGEAAVLLFRMLLDPELTGEIEVVEGGTSPYTVAAYAAQDLRDDRIVAVVVDAESCDPMKYRWTQQEVESRMMDKAPPDQWKAFLVVPEWEALLFQSQEVLRQLVGHELTAQQLERARTQPRQLLQELLKQPYPAYYDEELARRLASVDPAPLRSLPLREELLSFFRSIPDALLRHLRLPPYDQLPVEEPPLPPWLK